MGRTRRVLSQCIIQADCNKLVRLKCQIDELPRCALRVNNRTTDASNTGARTWAVPAPDTNGLQGPVANDTVGVKLCKTASEALPAGVDGVPSLPLIVVRDLDGILGQDRAVPKHGRVAWDLFPPRVEELDEVLERIGRVEGQERERGCRGGREQTRAHGGLRNRDVLER